LKECEELAECNMGWHSTRSGAWLSIVSRGDHGEG
jgi:hypothetical protein